MVLTWLGHGLAVTACGLVGLLFGHPIIGALCGAFLYLGRELAHHEMSGTPTWGLPLVDRIADALIGFVVVGVFYAIFR